MTRRILVVDDSPTNLKLVHATLRGEGYEVLSAGDASEAMTAIEDSNPELILMDIQLPGMDGLELTRRLKSNPSTRGIAIVAITAYAMVGDEQKARDAGCDDYVTKPIDTRALPGIVAAHLNGNG
jgi:CheY-like chemotaxis protein